MNIIQLHDTVFDILKKSPAFKQVLLDAGFHKLTNPVMLETVGRVTPLVHGMRLRGVSYEALSDIAKRYGFTLSTKGL